MDSPVPGYEDVRISSIPREPFVRVVRIADRFGSGW